MAKTKFLSLDPHEIDEHAWWYEEPSGITFVVEFRAAKTSRYIGTEQRTIGWGSVRAALKRRDAEDMAKMRTPARRKRRAVQHSEERS